MTLKRKHSMSNDDAVATWRNIKNLVTRAEYEAARDSAARDLDALLRNYGYSRPSMSWSGGKDSIALEAVCRKVGYSMGCCVVTPVEYPSFMDWALARLPDKVVPVNMSKYTLQFLRDNPKWLFPVSSSSGAPWGTAIQRTGQARFARANRPDVLLLGRRRLDGNYMGPEGDGHYKGMGNVMYFNPIRDWSHEMVLASCYYEDLVPPYFEWPNGFVMGTGPWPKLRRGKKPRAWAWQRVLEIEPGIVEQAARAGLPGAASVL